MLFASKGHEVRLFDVIPDALKTAQAEIQKKLDILEKAEQLKNAEVYNAKKQFEFIRSKLVYIIKFSNNM